MNDNMLTRLKSLKLSGIIKTLDIRTEEAVRGHLSYQEFFELLISDEVVNRSNNANRNRLSKAKFAQHKTIEEFNFSYQLSVSRQMIYSLATCEI